MTLKRYPVALLLLMLAVLLAACHEQSSVDKATEGGIFIMGIGTEPRTLDPQRATSVSEGLVLQALFEGLCSPDRDDDTIPRPGVARLWNSDPTGTVWSFRLRSSALWSDGEPVTSCDFVFAYHRMLHPHGGAKYADMLYVLKNAEAYNKDWRGFILCGQDPDFPQPWDELKTVNWQGQAPAGLDDKRSILESKGLDKLELTELLEIRNDPALFTWPATISEETRTVILERLIDHARSGFPDLWDKANVGVEAPTDQDLRLILRGPVTYLPLLTRHFTWMPVPSHILGMENDLGLYNTEWTQPGRMVSNGPFILKEWRFNDSILAMKNPQYRESNMVSLNGMKFLPIVNGFTETRMYFDGKMHATNNVPAEMMDYARKKGGDEFKLNPYYATTMYRLNTLRKPLSDKRVRLALSYAINQEYLVDNVARGAGTPAAAFTPPTSAYSPPRLLKYDPEKARQLLKEAGYPEGRGFPKLTILTTSREVQKTMTEAVQAQWKEELGIDVEIRASEWASYKLAQQSGDYDIAYASWSGDFPDPSTFLELWTGDNGNNNTGWSYPPYEKLIMEARSISNNHERLSRFYRAETILLEECPVIPLFWSKRAYLLKSNVKGWGPLQLDTRPYVKLSLEGQED